MRKHLVVRLALAALLSVGLYAFAAPTPAAHAAPPTSHTITHFSDHSAMAGFEYTQGDVTGFVQVYASLQGISGPIPLSGPAVQVVVVEYNNVTNESYTGSGQEAADFQIDSHKLTSATLQEVTVEIVQGDEFGNPIPGGKSFPVTLALTWTGVGNITIQSATFHNRIPHVINETLHFRGLFRAATVSGSVSYTSPLLGTPITLTDADSSFADMVSAGGIDVIVQH